MILLKVSGGFAQTGKSLVGGWPWWNWWKFLSSV